MAVTSPDFETVRQFLSETTRAVLITRRRDGGVQSSPMSVIADDAGNVVLTTRQTAAKIKNLTRDPYAALTLITERFLGAWMHVEGTAEIQYLPDAMPGLIHLYRTRGSQDTDSEAFKQRMHDEGRCLIRVHVTRVVKPRPRPAPSAR